jgi:hypothetical protein
MRLCRAKLTHELFPRVRRVPLSNLRIRSGRQHRVLVIVGEFYLRSREVIFAQIVKLVPPGSGLLRLAAKASRRVGTHLLQSWPQAVGEFFDTIQRHHRDALILE